MEQVRKVNNEELNYPTLSEQGKEEAQQLMNEFKESFKNLADGILGDLYTDVSVYIESDHWQNYRNKLMAGLSDYKEQRKHSFYDFKAIRAAILAEHREVLIEDLNQDMIKEIKELKERIQRLLEYK